MTSLYIHIPFCLARCHYCSFSSSVANQPIYLDYAEAVKKELSTIAAVHNPGPLDSLFFGGGTPSCLPCESLTAIISHGVDLFGLAQDAELSVEANPGTIESEYYTALLQAGVNRLSLGIQSFDDQQLSRLGRLHNAETAIEAVNMARVAGFTNISLDLIYGLPSQSCNSWKQSLATALSLGPMHLSLYQLMIEEQTPFYDLAGRGLLHLPVEEDLLEMDSITSELTRRHQFQQYEISNFSRPGFRCRHNLNYWHNEDYFAAGAAAVSFIGGCRQKRIADPAGYIERISKNLSVIAESETLEKEASFRETVILGLRMVEGVSLPRLQEKYAMDPLEHYGPTLLQLIDSGFIRIDQDRLFLSNRGWPVANQVMAQLV
jgi:oxygen-independent coproporphyrinogen-3 oxidase